MYCWSSTIVVSLLLHLLGIMLMLTEGSDEEYRLLQDLRKNYDPQERPIRDHHDPIVVNLRVILQQLVDVDEKNQMITLMIWLQQTWTDYKMKWDPEEYGGITNVRFPSAAGGLWKPDVLLFNSADDKFDASYPVNIVVKHTGDILFAPPGIVKSSCEIDITWFPFDEQICSLKYGSWTHNGNLLDLLIDAPGNDTDNQMDLGYYLKNGEWDLIATPAERVVTEFEGEKYVELYFRMHFRRKTMYYGLNWIIPSVIISLSNVLGFTLPSECGEKITLQITNLLSVTVFLGMVTDVTPTTSESVPVIAAFFSVSMLILGCSVMVTVLIINLHFRTPRTHRMSAWMRSVFLEWLPWLLLMARPGQHYERPSRRKRLAALEKALHPSPLDNSTAGDIECSPNKDPVSDLEKQDQKFDSVVQVVGGGSITSLRRQDELRKEKPNDGSGPREVLLSDSRVDRDTRKSISSTASSPKAQPRLIWSNLACSSIRTDIYKGGELKEINEVLEPYLQRIETTMQEVSEFLRTLRQRMDEEDEEEEENYDWHFVAMVVDRFCLFLFSGAILFASSFILINAPRLFSA